MNCARLDSGDEYLATGFTNVDAAGNADAYSACLSLLDALPYYRECKQRSYELLDLRPGCRVLDAGCGLGDDVFRMAERVQPRGRVVGVDSSKVLLQKAASDARKSRLPVEFHHGDLKALPFPDGAFSRCRVDRVLQHVPEPARAVQEMVRVLEPGGLMLAYDNDWETFSIASDDRQTASILEAAWGDSFTNPGIGRQLQDHFANAGLADIGIHPSTSVITDFETADRVYNLRETTRRAVASGAFPQDEGRGWIRRLIEQAAAGCFRVVLTAHTVIGRKPQSRTWQVAETRLS
jgi:ubiquinone/menaquinone biosynthesis C-methylase UbiE